MYLRVIGVDWQGEGAQAQPGSCGEHFDAASGGDGRRDAIIIWATGHCVVLMELEVAVLERVRAYESLSRRERSELGRELRRLGMSYGEIMELIPVKKSTLATWCRDVTLTSIEAIKGRRAPEPGIPRNTNRKRNAEIAELRAIARDLAQQLVNDPHWVAGLVLYWAEGAKTRNHLSMANTDPRAHRLFIRWVGRFIDPEASFSIALHLHEGNDEDGARRYWREQTGLGRANFHKTYIKPKGTGHRKNHLAYGVCTLTKRKSADAFVTTLAWIEFLQSRFGT